MSKESIIAEIGIEIGEFSNGMNAVVASIDKTTAATKEMDKATKAAAKSQAEAAKVAQKEASKTAHKTGQVAMQLQDVAVQAQMGTGALQIFAQQGSQVASVFGGMKGAVVGGALAIGATLVSAVYNSQKNFEKLNDETKTFSSNLANIRQSGGVDAIASGLGQAAKESESLKNSIADYAGKIPAMAAAFSDLFGGDDAEMRIRKLSRSQMQLFNERLAAELEIVRLTKIEQQAIDARNKGDEFGAQVIEEKIRLEKELYEIKQKSEAAGMAQATADKMSVIAKGKSELKLAEIAKKKEEKKEEEEKKAADADDKYFEQRKKTLQEIDDINNDFRKAAEDRAEKQAEVEKKAMEDVGKLLDEWNDEEVEARNKRIEKNKQNKESLADAVRETQIMDAQAHKSDLQAKLLKSQLETEQKIAQAKKDGNAELVKQLQMQQGITDMQSKIDEALKTPQQKREEKKAQKKRDSIERRIRAKEAAGRPNPAQPGGIAPRPMLQPNSPPPPVNNAPGVAGQTMRIDTLIVKTLKAK